jgi:hypothetical protein
MEERIITMNPAKRSREELLFSKRYSKIHGTAGTRFI